jgi:hypothetical protein
MTRQTSHQFAGLAMGVRPRNITEIEHDAAIGILDMSQLSQETVTGSGM